MITEGDSETGGRVRVQETRGGSAGHKEGHGRESQSGELKMLKIRTIVVNGKGRQLDIDRIKIISIQMMMTSMYQDAEARQRDGIQTYVKIAETVAI